MKAKPYLWHAVEVWLYLFIFPALDGDGYDTLQVCNILHNFLLYILKLLNKILFIQTLLIFSFVFSYFQVLA
jgi:hypothetical protein